MRAAFVNALRVERALPIRGGGSSGWPEFAAEVPDDEPVEPRLRPKAADVTHMHIILIGIGSKSGLINGAVRNYPEQRKALIRWGMWVAHGCRDRDGEHETGEQFAIRIGIPSTTLDRRIDSAAGVMAVQANRDGVDVWHAEKPVRRRKKRMNLHAAGM
ncbi:hypothetical protein PSQ19_06090 [Devosia algicola]|uniref:Uncharacterized protein n=1 Tax=Devosia algicola TaxID=3026418 RepID=A0ABY7YQN4_9HYPH|nr:hypothetical protein [Devosia algicola]WDR03638.1 hypothetical protein PSQ19_06090 [Devosia algicola]